MAGLGDPGGLFQAECSWDSVFQTLLSEAVCVGSLVLREHIQPVTNASETFHRFTEWLELEGSLKIISFHPPCHGRDTSQVEQ